MTFFCNDEEFFVRNFAQMHDFARFYERDVIQKIKQKSGPVTRCP